MTNAEEKLRNKMRLPSLLVILGFSLQAAAIEFKPYPSAKITVEQWQAYYDQVKGSCGGPSEVVTDQKLEIHHCKDQGVHIAFTQAGHPAHPAWISRQPVQVEKSIDIRTIGYFASEEPPFAKLFGQYLELNETMKKHLQQQGAAQ